MQILGSVWFLLSVSSLLFAQSADGRSKTPFIPEKTMAGRLLSHPTPVLDKPPLAKQCSSAIAVLDILVNEQGDVSSAKFVTGFQELREPSLTAVKQRKYRPYELAGHPVSVKTSVSIYYLGDGKSLPQYVPDGKGGVIGGNVIPLPAECGTGPHFEKGS